MNKKERKKKLLSKLEQLACDLVNDTEKIDQFAKSWSKGFRSYSFPNQILIWYQQPNASICAGFKTWNKHQRYVKKGSKGIDILAPGIYNNKIKFTKFVFLFGNYLCPTCSQGQEIYDLSEN